MKICMITVKLVYIVVTPPLLEFDNLFLGFFKCEMLLAIYTKVSNETRHWNYKKKLSLIMRELHTVELKR